MNTQEIIKSLRADYLQRPDRITWQMTDDDTRKYFLRMRRQDRKWRNDLYTLPEFVQVVQAGGKITAKEVFSELNYCRFFVVCGYHPKQILDATKNDDDRRDALIQALSVVQETGFSGENLAEQLVERIREGSVTLKNETFCYVFPEYVGKAGNASKDVISSQRGYFVTALNERIPDEVTKNRYALITKLLNHSGLDISRQHVRTIIKERARFR